MNFTRAIMTSASAVITTLTLINVGQALLPARWLAFTGVAIVLCTANMVFIGYIARKDIR
jgi:hypothetical protein